MQPQKLFFLLLSYLGRLGRGSRRTGSRDAIGEFKSRVANKMKVLAWSSHSRQSKAMAHVFELKR